MRKESRQIDRVLWFSNESYIGRAGTGPDPVSSGIPPAEPELTQELYKVPCHAAWFGYNDIHDIERKSVPDFFNGKAQSKTPKVTAPSLSISSCNVHVLSQSVSD